MIELSLEPEALPTSKLARSEHLRLRENAILEFTDSAGNGYLIEFDRYHGYSILFIEPDGDYWSVGAYFDELHEVLQDALEDFQDRYSDRAPDYSWHLDLREAAASALELEAKGANTAYFLPKLAASYPPKRSLFSLTPAEGNASDEIGDSRELEADADAEVEAEALKGLEATVARRGPIIDRLKGNSGLVYLVQRTDLNLFRFVALEPGKEPRYAGTQTTELREVYELIRRDARASYDRQRWFPMTDDLGAFIGRSEAEAEGYLILKKLYQRFPELSEGDRKFSEVLAVAEEITEIFGH